MNPNKPELSTIKKVALITTAIAATGVCTSVTIVGTPAGLTPCTVASLGLIHSIYAANDFSDLFKKAENKK
ncbi:MAG: hypothetical protein P4L31_01105 [Candidatus Babeliales bacterium]|nr:hypothetical protein [Candidatus Babeliales bacterium]